MNCQRTLAIYKTGQHIEGVKCSYYYTGKMPNSGRYVCHLCGKEKEHSSVQRKKDL